MTSELISSACRTALVSLSPLLLDMKFSISLQMVVTQLMGDLKGIEQHEDSITLQAINPFAQDILGVCLKPSQGPSFLL